MTKIITIPARVFLVAFSLLCLLAAQAEAAKVVRLYNAWPDSGIAFRTIGFWDGLQWRGPEAAGNELQRVDAWYEKVLPATWSATSGQNRIAFATPDWKYKYGANGFGDQSDIDIAAILRNSDTVWIVPDPLPGGKPRLMGTRPSQTVVMLLDPWEGAGLPPSLQVDGGAWGPMVRSSAHPGWASRFILGYVNLRLLFRNQDSTAYYGAAGTGPLPLPIDLDSLSGRDTVWVRPSPDPAGPPKASRVKPAAKWIFLFNPWQATRPIRTPRIVFEGGVPLAMHPLVERCGWYGFPVYERAPRVSFRSSAGDALGAAGAGSTASIDLSAILATRDTAWVAPSATGAPTASRDYTGEVGLCAFALLAATIRDFDTTHSDFQKSWTNTVRGMVLPTLGADRKPLKGPKHSIAQGDPYAGDTIDTKLATEWFHSIPGVNTETCRDIPLALDTLTGSYAYDNQSYFPIDDFRTLPDGTPNPRYNLMQATDGRMHNFHFCLESHGEFDYRKGQVFSFRGDDDVWFFIDGRLAVDIGGVHGPDTGSVRLDTMRLIEGNTYTFDFFFCERQTGGSSMKIVTDMNLRTQAGFQVRDTLRSPGVTTFDLYLSQKSGQGCAVRDDVIRTPGRFELTGPPFAAPRILAGGRHFGGIDIDAQAYRVAIDSASLEGLPPGDYELAIRSVIDSTKVLKIPFTVPFRASARFVAHPAVDLPVRGRVAVQVGAFADGEPSLEEVGFHLRPAPGIALFLDSAGTIAVPDTMRVGGGAVRTIWIVGTAPQPFLLELTDASNVIALDTIRGLFRGKGLRFVDETGVPLATVPAIEGEVFEGAWVRVALFAGDTICTSCVDTVDLASNDSDLAILAGPAGAPVPALALVKGRAALYLQSRGTVFAGSLTASAREAGSNIAWSPIRFLPRAPDSAFLFDRDGDGAGDSLWIALRYPTDPRARLAFGWPDTARRAITSAETVAGTPVRELHARLAPAFAATAPRVSGLPHGRLSFDGADDSWTSFPVGDRIGPVPLSATMRWGASGGLDTLYVRASEALGAEGDLPRLVQRLDATGWGGVRPFARRASGDSVLALLFAPDQLDEPLPGDSLRFASGISDTLGNPAGIRSVLVEGALRPPLFGWYRDEDGDGRIDAAWFRFRSNVRGPISPFTLLEPEGAGRRENQSAARVDADSTLLRVPLAEPWPLRTAFATGTWASMDAFAIEMRDSVAPRAVQAGMRFATDYDEFDTVTVLASEPLAEKGAAWLDWNVAIESPVQAMLHGDTLVLLYAPGRGPALGDSLRLAPGLGDLPGTFPHPQSPRIALTGEPRPLRLDYGPPRPLVLVDDPRMLPMGLKGMMVLVGGARDTTTYRPWDASQGAYSDVQAALVNGPTFVLDGPVTMSVLVYDNIGVHVAGLQATFGPAELRLMDPDPLGRVRIKIVWTHRTADGRPVADGIYLMRIMLQRASGEFVMNQVVRVGVKMGR